MAADVTLIAFPNVIDTGAPLDGEPTTTWRLMEYRTEQRHFSDDIDLGDGWWSTGDTSARLRDWFHRYGPRAWDFIEIGPWSPGKASLGLEGAYGGRHFLPPAQVAFWELLCKGRLLTPALAKTMQDILNRTSDHGSIYSRWGKRGTGRGKRKWRSSRHVAARSLKKWTERNMGKIVWVESW